MAALVVALGGGAAWAEPPPPVPLQAARGDYIEGRLDTGAGRADLFLLAPDGRPERRLLSGNTGQGTFRFVAGDPGQAFRVVPEGQSTWTLAVTRRVPRADQRPTPAAPTSPTMAALAADVRAGRGTAAFWRRVAVDGSPLVEPAGPGQHLVTFLWRGARRNVRLFGGPTNDHVQLDRLARSDVWFRTFTVPSSTRLSYQLAPDVPDLPGTERERRVAILATAQADPLNRHPWPADAPDAFSRQSQLVLPQAPDQPGLGGPAVPAGTLQRIAVTSAALGNTRDVTIYRPAGFDPSGADTVLLVSFDADEYLTKVPTPALLDQLIAAGRLPPVVAVLVANPDRDARGRELPDNAVFADFLADALLPKVWAETGLVPRPARTVLAGSSYGGLASATVALRRPDVFGNVLSMSGSFWWHPPGTPADRSVFVAAEVVRQPVQPLRWFLSAGLFETSRPGSDGILETNRHLRDTLLARGYPVHHREYAGGHDYLVWRGALADGLLALFGTGPMSVPHARGTLTLPAPPRSVVTYDLGALVTLDALGVDVAGLPQWPLPPVLAHHHGTPRVGSLFEPDVPTLKRAAPDLIVASGRMRDRHDTLAAVAPVLDVSLDPRDVEGSIDRNARALGRLFGREADAAGRLAHWHASVARVKARAATSGTALALISVNGQLTAFGPGSRFGLLHDRFGWRAADPLLAGVSAGRVVTPEDIARIDPDWLFVIDRDAAVGVAGEPLVSRLAGLRVRARVVHLDPVRLYITAGGLRSEQAVADELQAALDAAR